MRASGLASQCRDLLIPQRRTGGAAVRSQRFDATLLCALAAVAQEPCTVAAAADDDGAAVVLEDADSVRPMRLDEALARIRAPDWDRQAPVTLSPPQQMQVHLRQRHGGLGIISTPHRAPAAFLGRMAEALGTALPALPAAQVARLRARRRSPAVCDRRHTPCIVFSRRAAPVRGDNGGGTAGAAATSMMLQWGRRQRRHDKARGAAGRSMHHSHSRCANTAALIDITVVDDPGDKNCLVAFQGIQAHLIDA